MKKYDPLITMFAGILFGIGYRIANEQKDFSNTNENIKSITFLIIGIIIYFWNKSKLKIKENTSE